MRFTIDAARPQIECHTLEKCGAEEVGAALESAQITSRPTST
ncbi:hypothetical protein [Agromyces allii]|nr:hypothetical protein [Agromyces allii]